MSENRDKMFSTLPLEEPIVRRNRSGWSEIRILGDELRIAREAVGLSQIALAKLIFMNRSMISEIESGKREITRSQIRAWANITGKPLTVINGIVEWQLARNND
jgi:predicted transcriptional regulator